MHNAQALRHDDRNREVALSSKGYSILSKVASGSFSTVYKAKEMATSAVVAFKVTKFQTHIDQPPLMFQREVDILLNLDHENIVNLKGAFLEQSKSSSFVDDYSLGVDEPNGPKAIFVEIFDFCQQDLFELIAGGEILTDARKQQLMRDIIKGVDYLHRYVKLDKVIDKSILKI